MEIGLELPVLGRLPMLPDLGFCCQNKDGIPKEDLAG